MNNKISFKDKISFRKQGSFIEKINYRNILHSIWIGLLIGLVFYSMSKQSISILTFLGYLSITGFIGFIIGSIIEVITALLPAGLASKKNYFLINNVIALFVTFLVLLILLLLGYLGHKPLVSLMIGLGIVMVINLIEYLMYLRTNKKLKAFQKRQ